MKSNTHTGDKVLGTTETHAQIEWHTQQHREKKTAKILFRMRNWIEKQKQHMKTTFTSNKQQQQRPNRKKATENQRQQQKQERQEKKYLK